MRRAWVMVWAIGAVGLAGCKGEPEAPPAAAGGAAAAAAGAADGGAAGKAATPGAAAWARDIVRKVGVSVEMPAGASVGDGAGPLAVVAHQGLGCRVNLAKEPEAAADLGMRVADVERRGTVEWKVKRKHFGGHELEWEGFGGFGLDRVVTVEGKRVRCWYEGATEEAHACGARVCRSLGDRAGDVARTEAPKPAPPAEDGPRRVRVASPREAAEAQGGGTD